jgi:Sulfatase-modifying factor enzyme 1/TIR domain
LNPSFVFLSYSRTEQAAADELHTRLTKAGLAVFKDDISIRSGDRWQDVLQNALVQCASFVVLVGSQGVQRWVGAEVGVALGRNFGLHDDNLRLPIHPILLSDAPASDLPPFLGQFQSERWRPGEALGEGLLEALCQRQPRFDTTRKIEGCPYVGLATFKRDQSDRFFGRINETLEVVASLGDQRQLGPDAAQSGGGQGHCRWVQIEGHSGSGKSSLVNAGLLPLVQRGALWPRTGLENWVVLDPMVPGKDPAMELAITLERGLLADPARRDPIARDRALASDERALAMHLRAVKQAGTGYLLFIDQFEELYNLSEELQRKRFDALLAVALADPACPLFLVSTVRSDFLDRIEEKLPRLAAIYNTHCKRYLLPLVTPRGLRDAIEMPARLSGLDVSEVCTAMLRDAEGEAGALPLVENALRFLWRKAERSSGGAANLSGAVYAQLGGLAGILSAEADDLLARAERANKGDEIAALELLLRLTQASRDGRHTRQRISREEALQAAGDGNDARGERVLALLAGERNGAASTDAPTETLRLVTTGVETVAVDKAGAIGALKFVDLIHETLLRRRPDQADKPGEPYWPRLWQYIEKHADRDTLRRQLTLQAARWQSAVGVERWTRLASKQQLQDYKRLRVRRQSAEGHFIAKSDSFYLAKWAAIGAASSLLLFVLWPLVETPLAKAGNSLAYAVLVPVWSAGLGLSVPETVDLPALPTGQTFEMGCKIGRDDIDGKCPDAEPLRAVPMPAPCAMGKFEVTNLQYNRYLWEKEGGGLGPLAKYPTDGILGTPQRPAVNVSWDDAKSYAAWLSEKTKQHYRLPSEAEWEYAARLGSQGGRYPWGNESPVGRAHHNERKTAAVGSYPANVGLHDLYEEGKASRVLRGGSWGYDTQYLRAANRIHYRPDFRFNGIGFRVCRVSPIEKLVTGALNAEKLAR